MNEQQLDKLFRDKLEGLEVIPPPGVWSNIGAGLGASKSKNKAVLWKVVSVAAVLLIAIMGGWYFSNQKTIQNPEIAVSKTQSETKETSPTTILSKTPDQKIVSDNQALKSSESKPDVYPKNTRNPVLLAVTSDIPKADNIIPQNLPISEEVIHESSSENRYEFLSLRKAFIPIDKMIDQLVRRVTPINQESLLSEADYKLIAANSEIKDKPDYREKGVEIGFQLAPGYSSQNSNHSKTYAQNMTYSGSSGNTNVSTGISIELKTKSKWSFESGVYYSQNGQSSENSTGGIFSAKNENVYATADSREYFNTPVEVSNGQLSMNSIAGIIAFNKTPENSVITTDINNMSGFTNTLSTQGEFSQTFDFIEIPLFLRYNIVDSKIGLELIGGVSANFVVGNNVYMNEQKVGKTSNISKLNYSGTVGIGVQYALNKRFSLSVEPRFNYYLNSINKDVEVTYKPYRIGVYTGINYEF